ncbi:MAG TPA: GNAT family N-acetyltransferase [Bacillales bacterium]|nr:GNAT family N-acetyltransferase [Bacillales bacterium]
MSEIKIVEYEPNLAAAVAEMWTESQDNWGGGSAVTTKDEVLQQEANSSNLNLYIAMDGDKAVGYCGLSEYMGDEGALYIPLLNVRSDYHGKKIGKKLVLAALERTIELDWPRLDLYTWPGNTKAVPLYKKCGFFWEEHDESTHLMNYIPTVLATEAVKDFFEKADWYKDSTRKIEVKPDGRKENGFDFFEYSWESEDGEKLRVEFERKGRGMRLIETDDYLISASVENLKRVSGGRYPIHFEVVNKSGKPLNVSFEGIDDKNIIFTGFSREIEVEDKETIEGTFEVGSIEEEQDPFKTHPTVMTKLKINGKEALFKTGIMPKYPANISAQVPGSLSFTGVSSEFYFEMENNVQEAATFSFTLPESPFLHLEKRGFQVGLAPGEKISFAIPYQLKDFGFYKEEVDFTVKTASGEDLSFSKKITAAFKGVGAGFSGEDDDAWHIYNGLYHVFLDKSENVLVPSRTNHGGEPSVLFFPKLGKPFSDEFSRIKPESVDFFKENGAIVLKAAYRSNAFPGLMVIANAKLYAEGLVEHWYEIQNLSDKETPNDVRLYNWMMHHLYRPVLSYENNIVAVDEPTELYYEYWNSSKVTENWIFSRHDFKGPRGLCWAPEYQVQFDEWFLYFEHNFGKLQPHGKVATKPTFLSMGAFPDWENFRAFARQQTTVEPESVKSDVLFTANDHNPIASDSVKAVLKEAKSKYFDGTVTLKASEREKLEQSFAVSDKKTEAEFDFQLPEGNGLQLLKAEAELQPQWGLERNALVLQPGHEKVTTEKVEREGVLSYEADNGIITLKAAPDFFPTLYSLQYQGNEWMHHSFPKPTARSWWNPWPGGIGNYIRGLSANSIAKENHSARFAAVKDNFGNEWSGISVDTEVKEHEDYKGLRFNQHFLMLPGVPVVCHTTEIVQDTHRYFDAKTWMTNCFLDAGWVKSQNDNGEWQTFATRKGEIESYVNQSLIYGSDDRSEKLQVAANFDAVCTSFYLNKEATTLEFEHKIHVGNGQRIFTKPVFFILTDEIIPADALRDLTSLQFGQK